MKINNRIRRLSRYCKEYGIKNYLAVALSNAVPYSAGKKLSWKFLQNKHKVLLRYLSKYYYSTSVPVDKQTGVEIQYNDCIWTAWLQGEENAPEVIQMTLASIKRNSNGHKVIVLSNETIDQYIEVPIKIQQKYERGILCNAHYTDVIRMLILAKYGGLWLDATMFLTKKVTTNAFIKPFYSIGFYGSTSRFVSEYKWIVGIIGGCSNSEFLSRISEMLNTYWIDHNMPIDYFVFDYLVAVLYKKDKRFREVVDGLPKVNHYINDLRKVLNEPFDKEVLDELMECGQPYSLTYKCLYNKEIKNGRQTNYDVLVEELLPNRIRDNE